MAAYASLFSLEVLHGYFRTPGRLRLRFEPDPQTQAWLRRMGGLTRTLGNVLHAQFETGRDHPYKMTTGLGESAELAFAVYALDDQFGRYTDGLPAMDAPPLTFDGAEAKADGPVWRMAPAAKPAAWTAGPRPSFVVRVPLGGQVTPRADGSVVGRDYKIALKSRESRWKYLLLGDWAEARIVDPLDAVQFEAAPDATLPDGRVVGAFRSKAAIPLAERFEQRFELHAAAAPGGAPVRRVLPVPAAANLARDRGPDGAELLVSEIFVPR